MTTVQLGGTLNSGEDCSTRSQYLTFALGDELYALSIRNVQEIIEYRNVTPVPLSPSHIRGLINLRGAVVPVVDLSQRFGRGVTEIKKRSSLVISEIENTAKTDGSHSIMQIGVIVDAVFEVIDIASAEIERPPQFGSRASADFMQGMAKTEKGFTIVLDVSRVLTLDELNRMEGTESVETPSAAA